VTDIVARLAVHAWRSDGWTRADCAEAAAEIERLRLACTTMNAEVCQRLGKALGYPWFRDDQENFPGATEENGVCTGEHVAESIAAEAAAEIERLRAERDEAVATLALYRAENGCTRGQRTTQWCGEATKLRRAWLRVIQAENQCPASGGGCLAKRCGCLAEMEMLIGETGHD